MDVLVMKCFILMSLLIVLISTSVTVVADILCSKTNTTWERGVNNCWQDGGVPVTAQNIRTVELTQNLHVWMPDYFLLDDWSVYDWNYPSYLEWLCGFRYLPYDTSQSQIFFSDCSSNRTLLCLKYSGNEIYLEILNGTWNRASYCYSWNYWTWYGIPQPGYYWSSERKLGKRISVLPGTRIFLSGKNALCGAYSKETNRYVRNCQTNLTSLCQLGEFVTATRHFEECRISQNVHVLDNDHRTNAVPEPNHTETTTISENTVQKPNVSSTSKILLQHADMSNPTTSTEQERNVPSTTFSRNDLITYRLSSAVLTDQSESNDSTVSRSTRHLQDMKTTQATMHVNNLIPGISENSEAAVTVESHLAIGQQQATIQHGEKSADVSIIAGVAVTASLVVVAIFIGLVFVQRRYGCIQFGTKDRPISSTKQTKPLQEKNSFGASRAHANLAYVAPDVLRISTSELDICTNAVVKKPEHQMVSAKYKISPLKATNLSTEGHYRSNVSNNYNSPDTIKHNAISNPGNGKPCEYSFAVEETPAKEQPGIRAANTKQEDKYDTCAARKMFYPGEDIYDTTEGPDCRQDVYDSACQKQKMQKTLESEYGTARKNSLNEDYDCMTRKNDLNQATDNVYNRLY